VQSEIEQNNDLFYNQWQVDNFFTSKVAESRGRGAFSFVLQQKLLWVKAVVAFWALWLAFGFCKSKSRFKSPTKQGQVVVSIKHSEHPRKPFICSNRENYAR
jgi:hypothetical protein